MASLDEIVAFMDGELQIRKVPDYPGALNGLQMQGGQEVKRVAAAVDASLPVVREAVDAGVDLLVVHHGMFWSGARRVTGAIYEKFKTAMDAGMAIYSSHIPLDVHPVLGNNACLASALGLQDPQPFFEWKGILLGMRGEFPGSFDDLTERVAGVLGSPPPCVLRGFAASWNGRCDHRGQRSGSGSCPGSGDRFLSYRGGPALELHGGGGTGA